MKEFIKNGHCRACKSSSELSLHQQIFTNGSKHFLWVCKLCDRRNPSGGMDYYIPREKVLAILSAEDVELLPVILPEIYTRCVVCGNRATELHHWAPKHLFGESAEKWPKDYLCVGCHEQWHAVVTPGMSEREGA